MELSDFGKKLSSEAGILQLMDDLGRALAQGGPDGTPVAMFGGGNPAQIPAVSTVFKRELESITQDPARLNALLGNYDTPQGNAKFINSFVACINAEYGWDVTPDQVAVTPGSQAGFFMLFNILAGARGDVRRKILLPIVPEYIGYADQLIDPEDFVSVAPIIEKRGEHEYKYRIDFDALERAMREHEIAAIALSRPTNPTGNVVTDEEITRLQAYAGKANIPLIIDNAYGQPFPGVMTVDTRAHFDEHTVLSFSLSKVGLPSARVGIFVGPVKLMGALQSANAIVSLASPSYGQYITEPLLKSGELLDLARQHIQPFYFERAERARSLIMSQLPADTPWRLHVYEGSYFFWLWCDGARKTSKQMYEYLKDGGVITVPGEYFFPGQQVTPGDHTSQCLRLNFARHDAELEAGVPVLAEMVAWAYGE